jgi:hypothetical protein
VVLDTETFYFDFGATLETTDRVGTKRPFRAHRPRQAYRGNECSGTRSLINGFGTLRLDHS